MRSSASRLARLLLLPASVAPFAAQAFAPDMCAADRYAVSSLTCGANDVTISNIVGVAPFPSSCEGGTSITLDLDVTVNVGNAARYDVGIFISKDGKDGTILSTSGGATSCTVSALPLSPNPFRNLDSDTCGDIQRWPASRALRISSVTLQCNGTGSTSANLTVPYVVSWSRTAGSACVTSDDVVPAGLTRCNDSMARTLPIVVMPSIRKSDGITVITPGVSTSYSIVVTNNTGINFPTPAPARIRPVLTDPAVPNLTITGVTCVADPGAACPATLTVAALQGAGLTIPTLPNGTKVTFTVAGSVNGGTLSGTVITNTAIVALNGQTISASDSNTVVYPSLVNLKTVSIVDDPINAATNPKSIPGANLDYTIRVTNTGQGTVDLDALTVEDAIPANTELFVGDLGGAGTGPVAFTAGTSGLTYTYPTDIDFFDGIAWGYAPIPPYDPNVQRIRINPKGRMAADTGSGSPFFEWRFRARVK